MRHFFASLTGLGLLATIAMAQDRPAPALLVLGTIHSTYVVQPLHALGIEVVTCKPDELAAELTSGRYNAVLVATMTAAQLATLDAFLADGGGILCCNPNNYPHADRWTATCNWLAGHGARPRWELLRDSDADNVVRDVMGCSLSFTTTVMPPVADSVDGLLVLLSNSTTGWEPPMPYDFSAAWTVVVRGAESLASLPEQRHDLHLQPWLTQAGIAAAPPLMGVREVGPGRLAVLPFRDNWLIRPPRNCPTTETLLTSGCKGHPSRWLQVVANTVRWLAEPSLARGRGGATTPETLLQPPVEVWEPPAEIAWHAAKPLVEIPDQAQFDGLIGARTAASGGSGSVADYVAAAKAAGLAFIVFLEDSLQMKMAAWDELVAACKANSDETFAAVPGLTYEDAQGNHLYAFADNVQFPLDSMLLPDRRLATVQEMRSRAYFDYVNERMGQEMIGGFWRHAENFLDMADYKLYNSFPVYSFIEGKQVDDALDAYLYWMGTGGCQAVLAFEIMSDPQQVADRLANGWRVVCHRSPAALQGNWHRGAYSFSGNLSQYITNGPRILVWQAPNRLCEPRGFWWRPDQWAYRAQLRVSSDVGLRSVRIVDGDRQELRHWRPNGARTFAAELVLSNAQQLGLTPIVEDVQGRTAIGMATWSRNLNMEEFYCSDRCNFLGNSRLRTRAGRQVWTQVSFQANMGITPSKGRLSLQAAPAVNLTLGSPTLPIDGAPAGFPTTLLRFDLRVPDEHPTLFAYPQTYLVGPEIAIGQTDYRLAYDPAEANATTTPLGHAYTGRLSGWGNAWGSWHRLIPTAVLSGWSRLHACVWLPEHFRIGWFESDLTLKREVTVPERGLEVMAAGGSGWVVHQGTAVVAGPGLSQADGPFLPGMYATREDPGGAVVVAPLDEQLHFHCSAKGEFGVRLALPPSTVLPADEQLRYRIAFAGASGETPEARLVTFAQQFGLATPGSVAYQPSFTRGHELGNRLVWHLAAEDGAVRVRLPQTPLSAFLPTVVAGINDNWSVQLVDYQRPAPNHRALAARDGRAYLQLDLELADQDLFIGHPVVADDPTIKLLVSWREAGSWSIEAHNPTDSERAVALRSAPDWSLFAFAEDVVLPPGNSRYWTVPGP